MHVDVFIWVWVLCFMLMEMEMEMEMDDRQSLRRSKAKQKQISGKENPINELIQICSILDIFLSSFLFFFFLFLNGKKTTHTVKKDKGMGMAWHGMFPHHHHR